MQQAAEAVHEVGLRQAPQLGDADVAVVAVAHTLQLTQVAVQRGAQRHVQVQAVFGIQRLHAGTQHLVQFVQCALGLGHAVLQLRAQPRKRLARAQLEQRALAAVAHLAHQVAQAVARQGVEHGLLLAQQHGPQRRQPGRAQLELGRLAFQPAAHQLQPGRALAAQAAQFMQLLALLPCPLGQPGLALLLQRQHAVLDHAADHLAAPGQQFVEQGVFQPLQAAGGKCCLVTMHAGGERLPRREGEHPIVADPQRGGGVGALALHLGGHGVGIQQRIGQRVDLVEHHEALAAAVTQMVAPHRQVRPGDAGVGCQQKHRRMRRRQQRQRELGLGTDGVQPGGVEHHQAALEQRVRVVDQCMAPGRHLDHVVRVQRRVVLGVLVAPEAQRAGLGQRHLLHPGDGLQRVGQRGAVAHRQRHLVPQLGLFTQGQHRLAAGAGGDRQQRQRGRLLRVPGQFHRAHGGAPRCGRQHTPAGVGEEQRVDQLRLAARELGDEGHHQPVGRQSLAHRRSQRTAGRVEQAVGLHAGGQLLDRPVQLPAPVGQGIQACQQGGRHARRRGGVKKSS